jgi:hypothetical protein
MINKTMMDEIAIDKIAMDEDNDSADDSRQEDPTALDAEEQGELAVLTAI